MQKKISIFKEKHMLSRGKTNGQRGQSRFDFGNALAHKSI